MYYTEEELLEAVDILVEDYGLDEDEALDMIAEAYEMELYNEDEYSELLTENFIDDVKNEYEELRKRNPQVAGMVKAIIYTVGGPIGGLAYGIRRKQLMNRGQIDKEHCVVLRKTLKGLGYPLLAGIITTPGVAALGAVIGDGPENDKVKKPKGDKDKKSKKLKEDIDMYYTEEELLEAVDILVEEYGFYEDEAIEMIAEAYEMELLDEAGETVEQKEQISRYYAGMNPKNNPKKPSVASRIKGVYTDAYAAGKNVKDTRKQYKDDEMKYYVNSLGAHAEKQAGGALADEMEKQKQAAYDDVNKSYNAYRYAKDNAVKPIAKAAGVTAAGAAVAGTGAVLAHKAYKSHKAKKEAEARRRRSLRGRLSRR